MDALTDAFGRPIQPVDLFTPGTITAPDGRAVHPAYEAVDALHGSLGSPVVSVREATGSGLHESLTGRARLAIALLASAVVLDPASGRPAIAVSFHDASGAVVGGGTPPAADALLLEDASFLLVEDGSKLLKE